MLSAPAFSAYNEGDGQRSAYMQPQQFQQQCPLRRHGAPVPAPPSLLSTKSSFAASLYDIPVENFYESSTATATTSTSTTSASSPSSSSSGGTAPPSLPKPPHPSSSVRRHTQNTMHAFSAATPTTTTATSTPLALSSSAHRIRSRHGSRRGARNTPTMATVSTPLNATASGPKESASKRRSPWSGGAPRSLSRRARDKLSRSPTPESRARGGERPRVPPSRGPGASSVPTQPPPRGAGASSGGPTIVHANVPATTPPSPLRSFPDGDEKFHRSGTRSRGDRTNSSTDKFNSGSQSRSTASRSSSLPPRMPIETGVPIPSPTPGRATSKTPSDKVVTAGPVIMPEAKRKKAEREARKQLRASIYNGNIKVHGYVAQSAYAQKNPFRCQDFAEFAANPKYQPPPGFDIYSQAMATRVYGLEVSRASQGEFMMQRLIDAAHPATAQERAEMEALLSTTLENLQVGDWFYKWTRINHVHQRYVWLNLQRGTLMWSLSPKQSVLLNEEIKLSTVTSITPDCLQLEAPVRVFYRMTINTPDRCISLATEIRKKFDVWYRVLLQLTAPNLVYGVPGVWGRPSSSVNTTGRGAASRWASRFSPLDAVVDDTTGHLAHDKVCAQGLLSSSD